MSILGRKDKVAEAAEEIANTLRATEHIKELKEAQREIQEQINLLDQRMNKIEAALGKISSDVKLEALRELQSTLTQMQGTIFDKFSEMAVDIDRLKRSDQSVEIEADDVKSIQFDGGGNPA